MSSEPNEQIEMTTVQNVGNNQPPSERTGESSRKKDHAIVAQILKALTTLIMVLLVIVFIIVYAVTEQQNDSTLQTLQTQLSEALTSSKFKAGVLPVSSQRTGNSDAVSDTLQKYYMNIGLRQDAQMEECQGPEFKQSFPDIDYVFLGYNILKGFPLATGHDPGFTFPIFKADYSNGAMTADCRYSIPHGLVIIPDISCVTSFSSDTAQNKFEFVKSLSKSVKIDGSGWGASFSASDGYKESSSEIGTGESAFVFSTAHCQYYFSRLVTDDAPLFDNVFLKWVLKLNATNSDKMTYFNFFDTFGTHFLTEITFGARYTFKHTMKSQTFESMKNSEQNIAAMASYSGLFSIGGGFSMDSSQREAASTFSKLVTTQTYTVGAAPPSDGDAMTWASQVKTSPVPITYKLKSIEHLFMEAFMGHLNVDYNKIGNIIKTKKNEYCQSLLETGHVESCEDPSALIELQGTRLHNEYKYFVVDSITECIAVCMNDASCQAVTYCIFTTCTGNKTCYVYGDAKQQHTASIDPGWRSYVFPEHINTILEFADTRVVGNSRGFDNVDDMKASKDRCNELCARDTDCVAFSYSPSKETICLRFSQKQIRGLEPETGTQTFFI